MTNAEKLMTIDQTIRCATKLLQGKSPSPRLDAEVLLGHLLACTRLQLIMESSAEVSLEIQQQFMRLIERRIAAEPVAYLTGEREFFGLPFSVSPQVLVPRPETELLVETALRYARAVEQPVRILDLGTGSGCIPIALAVTLREEKRLFDILAVDRSLEALAVAQSNAQRHGVERAIEFIESDWFSNIPEQWEFQLIISNPPYIDPSDSEISPELRYEPQAALYAAHSGLADIEKIFSAVSRRSHTPKVVLVEIGARQSVEILDALKNGKYGTIYRAAHIEVLPDLAGHDRIISVQFL